MAEARFFIGLMSGTSLDGIDAVLADFNHFPPQILAFHHAEFSPTLCKALKNISFSEHFSLKNLGQTHTELGECYAKAVAVLLEKAGVSFQQVKAIGNHGQTVFHSPTQPYPFTLQIGNHAVLAARSQIPVVGDFRSMDMACGGQGAPLTPLFHAAFLAKPHCNSAIVNIGGIANVTLLQNEKIISAFDTGPGNGLLDQWMDLHFGQPFDHNGDQAKTGNVNIPLLNHMLNDPYFTKNPPKSTGRDYFQLEWVALILRVYPGISPTDVLRTLTELTAQSISIALSSFQINEIMICGGGAFNAFLMQRLHDLNSTKQVRSIIQGFHPQMIEPLAFAWLAKMRLENRRFDLNKITGSDRPVLLGEVFMP